jgi:uncharacterized protein (UPF0335 family)
MGQIMIGHNGVAGEQLRSIIERVERLSEEKESIASGIRDVFAEAKGNGFDPAIIKERKLDKAERQERKALLELYREALGMLADTPLGTASLQVL